ncbi:MAG: hypothetical protein KH345_12830, partial [Eubacterium sp.]|nr:hypothetical protein [Eubacterium sp.]
EVRLYALRGGLTTKMARTAHFRSHEVFRGDHNNPAIYGTRPELPPDSSMNASYSAREQQNIFDFNRNPVFP